MGISGLIPFLRPIGRQVTLDRYRGKTLAIDGYCWLHRGAFACAYELALGLETRKYVDFCVERIKLLQHYQIRPIMVFDGGPLPSKRKTEEDRQSRKEENMAKGREYVAARNHRKATEHFQRCVNVTPQMAARVIAELRAMGVEYVVAPYEADAQLRYLDQRGEVDAVISEDSDLLVFGCRRVILKMDKLGNGLEMALERLAEDPQFHDWSHESFRAMCILSGCDYLPSLTGMGLKTAHKHMKAARSAQRAVQILMATNRSALGGVDGDTYMQLYNQAERTFLHQLVYDRSTQSLVPLTPIPEGADYDAAQLPYCGEMLCSELARGIALGEICPISRLRMDLHDLRGNLITRDSEATKENEAPARGRIESFFAPQKRVAPARRDNGGDGEAVAVLSQRSQSDVQQMQQPHQLLADRQPEKTQQQQQQQQEHERFSKQHVGREGPGEPRRKSLGAAERSRPPAVEVQEPALRVTIYEPPRPPPPLHSSGWVGGRPQPAGSETGGHNRRQETSRRMSTTRVAPIAKDELEESSSVVAATTNSISPLKSRPVGVMAKNEPEASSSVDAATTKSVSLLKSRPVGVMSNTLSPPKSRPVDSEAEVEASGHVIAATAKTISSPEARPISSTVKFISSPPKTRPSSSTAKPISLPKTRPISSTTQIISPPKMRPISSTAKICSPPKSRTPVAATFSAVVLELDESSRESSRERPRRSDAADDADVFEVTLENEADFLARIDAVVDRSRAIVSETISAVRENNAVRYGTPVIAAAVPLMSERSLPLPLRPQMSERSMPLPLRPPTSERSMPLPLRPQTPASTPRQTTTTTTPRRAASMSATPGQRPPVPKRRIGLTHAVRKKVSPGVQASATDGVSGKQGNIQHYFIPL